MVWHANRISFFIQSIALYAMLFFVSLAAMEPAETVKRKKKPTILQRLKGLRHVPPLVNCGLTDHLIPQEVMALISLNLTLQDLGRLNRVKKNSNWDLEHICDCTKRRCNRIACRRLAKCHYEIRTKVLAHYAQTRNIWMFHHLWVQDKSVRDLDLDVYLTHKYRRIFYEYPLLIEDKMKEYSAHYSTSEKIEKRRLKQLIQALSYGDSEAFELLQEILPGSGFNIFYTAKEYRKKQVRKTNSCYYLRDIFKNACKMEDPDFLLMMLDGKIHPHAFKYIVAYANWGLINDLRWKYVFVTGIRDKHGKDFETYIEDYIRSMEKRISY
jgi:hypothetical protein